MASTALVQGLASNGIPPSQPAAARQVPPPNDPQARHKSNSSHHHHPSKASTAGKPDAARGKPAPPAPSAPAGNHSQADALGKRLRRDTPFLATIRFRNDLPEVPGDPKLLVSAQLPEQLAEFSLASIEKEPKHDLMLPADLGITLSVLDMERYALPRDAPKPALHPDDYKLLGADADALLLSSPLAGVSKSLLGQGSPAAGLRRGTALRSAAEVSWLMRTTYLSSDADGARAKHQQTEYDARRQKLRALEPTEDVSEADEETQRLAQIRLIESTFTAARQPPAHPSKPGMRPIEIMEVLPDVDWWSHKFMVAHFDKDPAQDIDELAELKNDDLAKQVVSLSVLKGFKLEEESTGQESSKTNTPKNDGRFMALLLPRNVQAAAAMLQDEGNSGLSAEQVEGEFDWAREYQYNLNNRKKDADRATNTPGSQQAYLLRFQGGRALYCELNSTLELRGKREGGALRNASQQFQRPSKVVLRKRAANANEKEEAKRRRGALREGPETAGARDAGEAAVAHDDTDKA